VENPWKNINTSCRVCEIDKDYFVKNKHLEISQIEIPEPFIGCPEAPIYILMGSPLVSIEDLIQKDLTQKIEDEKTEEHPSLARSNSLANITNPFEYKDYPFYSNVSQKAIDKIISPLDKLQIKIKGNGKT